MYKVVQPSQHALSTSNPIRKIVDSIKMPQSDKEFLSLSIGDPTAFPNLQIPDSCSEAIVEAVRSKKANGYVPSFGTPGARTAVAGISSMPESEVTADDVFLTSGCSSALELAITSIADAGSNLLIPRPGFPLYETHCDSYSIESRPYTLQADKGWEVDLAHMRSLIDDKTSAILVNNPSNPCGSNYSRKHLEDILAIAKEAQLPIIADEIYADMVFSGEQFFSLAALDQEVPIIQVGGLAKKFLVPGWRVGWITLHDHGDKSVFAELRPAIQALTTLIMGANSLVQAAIPEIINNTDPEFFQETLDTLEFNAKYCHSRLLHTEGLEPITPQGAMYLMCRINVDNFDDTITDDVTFAQKLVEEESVFVLPGQCFSMPNFFRVVVCPPEDKLEAAFDRIDAFCVRHRA